MAVNRFDQPVQSEYISQYTPIPFQELYNLGKEYNSRVDNALNTLSQAIKQYKDFKSPSAIDTQRWYDLTLKGAYDIAQQVAKNPDLLKTTQGRNLITNYINSRPYAQLSALEQSRDKMLDREKNVAKLINSGKYNPLWHDYNYNNYDTLTRGIFKDTNVVPYTSEVDILKPYLDNLKDSYINTRDGYDYFGVTPERVKEQIDANRSAIFNSPYAAEHVKQLMRQGLSYNDALSLFATRLDTASNEFVHSDRRVNPFARLKYNDELIRRRKRDFDNDPENPRSPQYLTNRLRTQGAEQYNNARIDALLTFNPIMRRALEDAYSDNPTARDNATRTFRQLDEQFSSPKEVFRTVLNQFGNTYGNNNTGLKLNNEQLADATSYILANFSRPISGRYRDAIINTIPGISSKEQNTPLGKYKVISSGTNMDLTTRTVAGIAGLNPSDSAAGRNKFLNELKSGGITNLIVLGNERIMTIPTVNSQGDPDDMAIQTVRVAISDEQLKQKGLTDQDMRNIGATKRTVGSKSSTTKTLSGSYDSDTDETNYEKVSNSSSTTSGNSYWIVDLSTTVPLDDLGAEYLNQQALQLQVNPATYSDFYLGVQDDAYLNND